MANKFQELIKETQELKDIGSAISVLSWDQDTYMPEGGAKDRARQLSTLSKIHHERFTSKKIGDLLEQLSTSDLGDYDSLEASVVRYLKREYDKALKIPSSLIQEQAETTGIATSIWVKSKRANDFAVFLPHLEKLVELSIKEAEYLGYEDSPYDALLDKFEPGIKSTDLDILFGKLKAKLIPLVNHIASSEQVDASFLQQNYDTDMQWDVTMKILKLLNYDFDRGRQDKSEHPFTTSFSRNDVRITTRIQENLFAGGMLATIHEYGHAMYEQGIPEDLGKTPIGHGASSGVHESQSRLWENLVGKSYSFWQCAFPIIQKAFPAQLGEVDTDRFYRAINKVEPSLIRVEADEVTYNLHIFFRYELEKQLIEGKIKPQDLPDLWNEKLEEYLGIKPDSDTTGVLQDIHWAGGMFGYFPTYSLGSILAVQWFERIKQDIPHVESSIESGNFQEVIKWLNNNVHIHGAKYNMKELVYQVLNEDLSVEPFINYIEEKYNNLY